MSIPEPDFTKAGLTDLLTRQLGYSGQDALDVTDDLLTMQPAIREAFIAWWRTGVLPSEPVYEGHSAASLAETHHLLPPSAFLTLDWLATDPLTARKALSEGYDTIITG